ncbi:hypothetical protein ATK78_1511 [Pedobacter metabolipauper]|uniref:Uncharacterized protein n=1 Tax=Pedobacter metabolipauper TaxID=425513 RepID=A0A4V3D154_9SPHI|nr:hypothetical protein ATK78_1511 [Pedobacter metabolipauper]
MITNKHILFYLFSQNPIVTIITNKPGKICIFEKFLDFNEDLL